MASITTMTPSKKGGGLPSFTWQILLTILLIVAWEILPGLFSVSPLILPPLHTIFTEGFQDLAESGLIWRSLFVTTREIFFSYLIAVVLGIGIGILLSVNQWTREVMRPILSALFAIPVIALIPLFLVTFGIGELSKIAFGALYGFFPILFNTVSGISNIQKIHLRLGPAFGLTLRMRIFRILYPGARSDINNGMRIGLAITIVAVVSAEMFGSVIGLGFLIQRQSQLLNGPAMWSVILLTILLAYVCLKLLNLISGPSQHDEKR